MMMRVKLVIISTRAGMKLRLVSSSRVWIDSDHWCRRRRRGAGERGHGLGSGEPG
jgi:hypothetical protein